MAFCAKCGSKVAESAYCGSCGTPISRADQRLSRPTRAWYLVPFFFSLIGGIIGYFAVKNDDKPMANRLLIFGLVMFVLTVGGMLLFDWALIVSLSSV